MSSQTNVLLAGSTGLVGSFVLDRLKSRADIGTIFLPVRKTPPIPAPSKKTVIIPLEGQPPAAWFPDAPISAVFCCVGTTIKKAGDKKSFCDVDFKIPVELAKEAKKRGIPRFAVVSAKGAGTNSFFFYNRVKGEMEAALKKIQPAHLVIARPSLLTGPRKEIRRGERIAEKIFSLLNGLAPKSIQPNPASEVARALVDAALSTEEAFTALPSRKMTGA